MSIRVATMLDPRFAVLKSPFGEKFVDYSGIATSYDRRLIGQGASSHAQPHSSYPLLPLLRYQFAWYVDSLTVLLLTFKLFKYFQVSPMLDMLRRVLAISASNTLYFVLFLMNLMLGFSVMGQQMFGTAMEEFENVLDSFLTLTQMLLGRVDYIEDMLRVNPSFGLMYFLAYILIMFIIFINVFLAILGEAYSMVREKMEEEEEERKKAEKGRRKRTFGEWLKMLRAVWKARKAKQAKAKAAGG